MAEFIAGIGISPGVPVHPAQEALLEGTDPVLNKAVDVIRNWVYYYKKQ